MHGHYILTTTVASGFSHSAPVSIPNASLIGVWAPIVDSCQAFFKVSFNTTSANFVRLSNTGSASDPFLTWNLGVGSKALILGDALAAFSSIKIELGVTQTDNRLFTIVGRG